MPGMKYFRLFLVVYFTLASLALAEEAPPPTPEEQTFPSVAEIIPQAARLAEEALGTESKLTPLGDLTPLKNSIEDVQNRQTEITQRVSGLGDPAEWNFDRLLEVRATLNDQMAALKKILDVLSERLATADQLQQEWKDRETFWKEWREQLKNSKANIPKSAFSESAATCQRIGEQAKKVAAPLVDAQKEISGLQTALLDIQNQIDSALNNLRQQTFKKTTHSFFNGEFYQQFNAELLLATQNGIVDALKIKWDFLRERPLVPFFQVLLALCLTGFILRHRRGEQIAEEWRFIAEHPWATGIFVAMISLSALYVSPPSFWRMGITLLIALSSAILVSGLLKNPHKQFIIYLLAVLFTITQVLQLIAFPAPLYRLYLTALCLLGIPLLLLLALRNLKTHEGRTDWFTRTLRIGAAVLILALVAQISGYSNLSSRLINSSVSTIFLGLYLIMTIRLAHGGIRFLLTHPVVIRRPFFYRYGDDLIGRLSKIVKIFIGAYSFLYLFVVWGIYNSIVQAWTALMGMSVKIGEVTISLHMIALVTLVLYFAFSISWFLQAVLEAQVFPHQDLDRGIRDAIKKLLHYAIVFFGFLFAMSLAGVELKNFAFLAGAFGIGIGFGLQNIVNNFVSGIILLFERPVRVGDVVVIDGQWSTVRKIGLRSTLVETPNKSEIIVPNAEFISQKVTNWTLSSSMARIVIPVGAAYGSDVVQVLKLLEEAAKEHEQVLQTPAPSPIFTAFGESSLDFELRVWVADADSMLGARSNILQSIDRLFREAGIEMPFPQRDIHLSLKDAATLRQGMESMTPPPIGDPDSGPLAVPGNS